MRQQLSATSDYHMYFSPVHWRPRCLIGQSAPNGQRTSARSSRDPAEARQTHMPCNEIGIARELMTGKKERTLEIAVGCKSLLLREEKREQPEQIRVWRVLAVNWHFIWMNCLWRQSANDATHTRLCRLPLSFVPALMHTLIQTIS